MEGGGLVMTKEEMRSAMAELRAMHGRVDRLQARTDQLKARPPTGQLDVTAKAAISDAINKAWADAIPSEVERDIERAAKSARPSTPVTMRSFEIE